MPDKINTGKNATGAMTPYDGEIIGISKIIPAKGLSIFLRTPGNKGRSEYTQEIGNRAIDKYSQICQLFIPNHAVATRKMIPAVNPGQFRKRVNVGRNAVLSARKTLKGVLIIFDSIYLGITSGLIMIIRDRTIPQTIVKPINEDHLCLRNNGINSNAGKNFVSEAIPIQIPETFGLFWFLYASAMQNNQIGVSCPSENVTGGHNKQRKHSHHGTLYNLRLVTINPNINHPHKADANLHENGAIRAVKRKAVGGCVDLCDKPQSMPIC